MNAAYHPYTENLTSQQDSNSPENFSPVLVGYHHRNNTINNNNNNNNNNNTNNNNNHHHGSGNSNSFLSAKHTCENQTPATTTSATTTPDIQQAPQLTFMDDVSNDYHHNHQILNSNTFKICGGCGDKISDRYLLYALDRYWHNSCLKCHCCGAMLADVGSSCYTRRGLILCKKDYSSMFGCSGICAGCGETIPPNEMVAKAIPAINNVDIQKPHKQIVNCVFHLKCFTCAKCGSNLRPGDRYTMVGSSLICEQDWQKIIKNSPTATANGSMPTKKGKVGRPRRTKD